MKITVTDERCKFFIHIWKFVKHIDGVNYFKCKGCSARKAELDKVDKAAIRNAWLEGKVNTLKNPPKRIDKNEHN